jgi:hypothetical protein
MYMPANYFASQYLKKRMLLQRIGFSFSFVIGLRISMARSTAHANSTVDAVEARIQELLETAETHREEIAQLSTKYAFTSPLKEVVFLFWTPPCILVFCV